KIMHRICMSPLCLQVMHCASGRPDSQNLALLSSRTSVGEIDVAQDLFFAASLCALVIEPQSRLLVQKQRTCLAMSLCPLSPRERVRVRVPKVCAPAPGPSPPPSPEGRGS